MKPEMEHYPELYRSATKCRQQWLYLVGEEGVIYSQVRNRFIGLDAAGVSAYQAFDAGASVRDLQPFSNTDADFAATEAALNMIFALSQGEFPQDRASEDHAAWPACDAPRTANLEIHGIPILVDYPSGVAGDLCRDCFRSCLPSAEAARFHLHSRQTKDGWSIFINGQEFFSGLREDQVGLGYLHAVRTLLYAHGAYDVAFHAAVVADRCRGIMLCAPRESGKSTLAAHLAAQGFRLVTDEPAMLHLDTVSISTLKMPISLKEGSWNALHHEWPQLAGSPMHVRSDNMNIRLLHPQQAGPVSSHRLTHIIFPMYSPLSPAKAEKLTPIQALALLNEGGMLLAAHVDRDGFESFLRLICRVPAFIVRYRSLQEAEELLASYVI